MTENQITSWKDLQDKIKGNRKKVYNALQYRPMALFELCNFLGWQINCISGRVSELSKMGAIEQIGSRVNPSSGKMSTVWATKQLELF